MIAMLLLTAGACTESGATGTSDERGDASASDPVSEGDPRLRACVEAAGYDWGEAWPPWSSPEPAPEGSVWADPAFQQAWEGCLANVGLGEPFDQERISRESREVLKYVACMRKRGWNLPDPLPSDSPLHPGLLDRPIAVPSDPEAANHYYRDSADCGFPFYDENDNLLPIEE